MTSTYQKLLQHKRLEKPHSYDTQRAILYGLGIGLGFDPLDERQLPFVLEDNLQVFPTFASVATWDISFLLDLGIEWTKLIHLAQSMEIHQPFPPSARLLADNRIVDIWDKPKQNATILISETIIRDAGSDVVLANLQSTSLARDFRVESAPAGPARPANTRPKREVDDIVSLVTSPQVALIYRLLGGGAKIHSTPSVAREQGFEGPIMHGLSTWGHVCHAVLRAAGDYDAHRLKQYSASFTAPVYPGDELTTHLWIEGAEVYFETWVLARNQLVLADGRAYIAPS
jgi:acyl dehydratase